MQRFNRDTGIMEVVSPDSKIRMRFDMRLLVEHVSRRPDPIADPAWEWRKVGVRTARKIIKIIVDWAARDDMDALDAYIRQNDKLYEIWRGVLQKDRRWKEGFLGEQR